MELCIQLVSVVCGIELIRACCKQVTQTLSVRYDSAQGLPPALEKRYNAYAAICQCIATVRLAAPVLAGCPEDVVDEALEPEPDAEIVELPMVPLVIVCVAPVYVRETVCTTVPVAGRTVV